MKIKKPVAAFGFIFLAAGAAHAELVNNGGFETGSLSGFSISAAGGGFVGVDAETPHSGSFAAFFAGTDPNAPDTISQSIATIPGNRYAVSFFLQDESSDTPDNAFSAQFGGTTLLQLANDAGFAYRSFSQTVVATAQQSVLSFTGYNVPTAYDLDDISILDVTPAAPASPASPALPEPGTTALLLVGMLGMMRRARRR